MHQLQVRYSAFPAWPKPTGFLGYSSPNIFRSLGTSCFIEPSNTRTKSPTFAHSQFPLSFVVEALSDDLATLDNCSHPSSCRHCVQSNCSLGVLGEQKAERDAVVVGLVDLVRFEEWIRRQGKRQATGVNRIFSVG